MSGSRFALSVENYRSRRCAWALRLLSKTSPLNRAAYDGTWPTSASVHRAAIPIARVSVANEVSVANAVNVAVVATEVIAATTAMMDTMIVMVVMATRDQQDL